MSVLIKENNKIKKHNVIVVLLCISLVVVGSCCYAIYTAKGHITSVGNIEIEGFTPKVNGNSNFSQTINLVNTITNNKSLAPGAEGSFNLNINFTDVSYDADYEIYYDGTNLPNNLHFYTDSNRTNSLTTIEGVYHKTDINKTIENTIYWKWDAINDSDSNTNDNLFINQNLSIPFTVEITQRTN